MKGHKYSSSQEYMNYSSESNYSGITTGNEALNTAANLDAVSEYKDRMQLAIEGLIQNMEELMERTEPTPKGIGGRRYYSGIAIEFNEAEQQWYKSPVQPKRVFVPNEITFGLPITVSFSDNAVNYSGEVENDRPHGYGALSMIRYGVAITYRGKNPRKHSVAICLLM